MEADPARLAVVQDRRAELGRLVKLYGAAQVPRATAQQPAPPAHANGASSAGEPAGLPAAPREPDLGAVLAWARGAVARLAELDGDDDRITGLEAQERDLAGSVAELAGQLTAIRKSAAGRFEAVVTAELAELAMPHARLATVISPLPDYGPQGADDVETAGRSPLPPLPRCTRAPRAASSPASCSASSRSPC